MTRVRTLATSIDVSIADHRLAGKMTRAITRATRAAERAAASAEKAMGPLHVVRVRARRTVARIASELPGSVAIVDVTERNARHLPELVESLRASQVAGVQMVWNGTVPERSRVERYVFDALERARATPAGPPVVLSREHEPAGALRILIATMQQRKNEARS